MADGSIIIDTRIDSSGAERDARSLSSKLGSVAGQAVGTATKVTAAMVTVAAGAVATLTTLSVKQYAEYEQLVGGVETLFKDSSKQVLDYANNAYKAAGMSANEYMNTITGFSASLLQGLGGDTKKAAEIGNKAVEDMSDNANKMGTAMGSIQDAYQGFAKQNYTMLDNLKLGYGGTKEEMQRLLVDAEKLSGIKYDLSNFSDIIEAIHVIQNEMGITGTTAREASETISGSLNMTKAAWTNMLTGMADDNADFDKLIDNLIDSAAAFGKNILPRIKIAIDGVGKLISRLAKELPKIVNEILPDLVKTGADVIKNLIGSIKESMPLLIETALEIINTLVNTLIELLPELLEMGIEMIISLASGLAKALPTLIPKIVEAILTLVDTFISNIDLIIDVGIELILALIDGIIEALPILIEKLPEIIIKIVEALIENSPKLIEAAILIVFALVKGIAQAIPQLLGSLKTLFISIGTVIKETNWKEIGTNIMTMIYQGVKEICTEFWNWLCEAVPLLWEALYNWVVNGWTNIINYLKTNIPIWIESIFNWFNSLPGKIGQALGNVLGAVISWGINMLNYLVQNVPIWIDTAIEFFKSLPSRLYTLFVETVNKVVQWGQDMLVKGREGASNTVNTIVNTIKTLPSKMLDIGKNIVKGLWEGIKGAKDWLFGKVGNFVDGIVGGFKKGLDINSPSRVLRDEVGVYAAQGVGVGFDEESDSVAKGMATKMQEVVGRIQGVITAENVKKAQMFTIINEDNYSEKNSDTSTGGMLKAIINIDGKPTMEALAPYQSIMEDYNEGRS